MPSIPFNPIQSQNLSTYGNKQSLSLPLAQTALVAEGGGQRGIFTAGILDAWLENDFNPFQLLIGTSAGAQKLIKLYHPSARVCTDIDLKPVTISTIF